MTNPTIQINVDTKEAIAAINELTAAIERANAALKNLSVSVEPTAQMPSRIVAGDISVHRIVANTRAANNIRADLRKL